MRMRVLVLEKRLEKGKVGGDIKGEQREETVGNKR